LANVNYILYSQLVPYAILQKGDFRQEQNPLVVVPSGEPVDGTGIYASEKPGPINLVSEYRFT
jgi:hypothetical protein